MKITTLLENTACSEELRHAHGLSLYVETAQHKLLFDMGPGRAILENAEKLGIDLSAVDLAVLSHGHYDHGGGLKAFLETNDHAPVCIHEGAFGRFYALEPPAEPEYIGLNPELKAYRSRFAVTRGVTQLDTGLLLFDGVKDDFGGMAASALLQEKTAEGFRPDDFHHEQNLLVEENGKTVLIAGCAHCGIVNIRARAEALLGREVDAVISGFHLYELEPGAAETDTLIERTGKALLTGNTVYYTGHCTGDYAYERLKTILGGRLHRISGGETLTF